MNAPSPDAVQAIWWISLGVFLVVLVIVALLLTLIVRVARQILGGVEAIWNTGQRIANNTVHIALLKRTNDVAGQILGSAVGVVHGTAALHEHAKTCPACPACVLGPPWKQEMQP